MKKFVLPLVGALVAGLIVAAIAMASIPDSSGIIHGCYQPYASGASGGSLSVIDSATQSCNGTSINWSQGVPGYQIATKSFSTSTYLGSQSVSCPSGTSVLGGGYAFPNAPSALQIFSNGPISDGSGWEINMNSYSGSSGALYAICGTS